MPIHCCPICNKEFTYESIRDLHFPFCSQRCKLIDLGEWLEGKYVIPGSEEEDSAKDEKDEKGAKE